jgi:hypothetical protein
LVARALLVWGGLLVLAILNGALREALLGPWLGEAAGRRVSSVLLAVLIGLVAWLTVPWIGPATARQAWAVGALWTVSTLAFELLGGHYLFGRSWPALLADYDVRQGRLWILVLLATLVAPAVAWNARLR